MLRSDCAAVESVSATAIVWSGLGRCRLYDFDGGESHMDLPVCGPSSRPEEALSLGGRDPNCVCGLCIEFTGGASYPAELILTPGCCASEYETNTTSSGTGGTYI